MPVTRRWPAMLLWWAIRISWLTLLGIGALMIGGWMKAVIIIFLLITSLCSSLIGAERYVEPKKQAK